MPPMPTASLAFRCSVVALLVASCAPEQPAKASADVPAQSRWPQKQKPRPRKPSAPEVVKDPPPASSEPPVEKSAPDSPLGEVADVADPLAAHPRFLYAGRVNAFFKRGFRCPEVPPEEKASCRPTAKMKIDKNGVVEGFTLEPCTTSAAINAAVEATLRPKVGQTLPPPPPDVPPMHSRPLSITFVCE